MQKIISLLLFTTFIATMGFADEKVSLFVSIVPQKYFVHQLTGELADIHVMVLPGASPATYEPKPKQMAALAQTDLYFAIGVPFEKNWLPKIRAINPSLEVIYTDQAIKKLAMRSHHHFEAENAASQHEHHQPDPPSSGPDPHIWLSPPLVKIQAQTMLAALQKIDPEHRRHYEANFNKFASQLDQLDRDLKKNFAGCQGMHFMVFHPSWGYFARTYGLNQLPIEIEGKNPKPSQLKELIQYARKKGIKAIFVQPQFSTKSAQIVAREIKGHIIYADPLALDWMDNMRTIARELRVR